MRDYEEFVGRTEAFRSVEVRSRVTGYLDKTLFKDGDEVQAGQDLFEIDPRQFQAEHEKALADVKLAEADLKSREADIDRSKPLVATGAVTRADFDKQSAARDTALATLAANKTAAGIGALRLRFTHIHASFAGRASRALVSNGNLVSADSTLLTTVVSVDPIYVYFNADERTHLRVQRAVRDGKLKLDKGEIPVSMGLAGEEDFPNRGMIDFSDNRVDPATGTIQYRSVFSNPKPDVGDRKFEPGLFARIRMPIGMPYQALLVAEGRDRLRPTTEVRADRRQTRPGRDTLRGTGAGG